MSESGRPSFQSVQRGLIIGVLAGLIFGCILGSAFGSYYAWQVNPVVYTGDAIPPELAPGYQNHYLAMVVDSYIVNQDVNIASERLKAFEQRSKIQILAERAAAYVAAGRGVEAQLIYNLALSLKSSESWNEDTIKAVVAELSTRYQSDPARAQAISTFSAQLLQGQVPVPAEAPPVAPGEAPPVAPASGGIPGWLQAVAWCLLLVVLILVAVLLAGRYQLSRKKKQQQARQAVVWEGEGAPPLKQWSSTFELGQDSYEDFFNVETNEGDFLGESGIEILDAVPDARPKQVLTFELGLFDKTDITTIYRIIMSEYAYHDENLRAKVDAKPQAQPVLAEPGAKFDFETSAIRIEAELVEVAYGGAEKKYFTKLKTNLKVFIKEGADLKLGHMDVPEEYR